MYTLFRGLNDFTEHTARLITFKKTYLDYGTDVFNPPLNQVKSMLDDADFYILGELISPNIISEEIYTRINHTNCIIRAGGSVARYYPHVYTSGKFSKIIKTGAYHDWSLSLAIHPMASTVNMYYFNEFPEVDKPEAPPYKLHFSGTKLKRKGAHIINTAWQKLHHICEGTDKIEFVQTMDTPWSEALKLKGECHIQYDHAMALGAYANNTIEAMYYKMPVFCSASGWCRSIYPDLPVINISGSDELVQETMLLIDKPEIIEKLGELGHEFVMRVHSVENAIRRWEALIDYVTKHYTYATDHKREDVVYMNVDIYCMDGNKQVDLSDSDYNFD